MRTRVRTVAYVTNVFKKLGEETDKNYLGRKNYVRMYSEFENSTCTPLLQGSTSTSSLRRSVVKTIVTLSLRQIISTVPVHTLFQQTEEVNTTS
jgi:hypothetical protein